MKRARRIGLALATGLAGLSPVDGTLSAQAPIDRVVGLWSGSIENAGSETTFALRFARRSADSVEVYMHLPAIGIHDQAVGVAYVDGVHVRLGAWSCTYDSEADVIRGDVPSALLPVYSVPFALQRTGEVARVDLATPPSPAATPLWSVDLGAPVWAGFSYGEGILVVGTDAGGVHALDERGEVLWTAHVGGPVRADPAFSGPSVLVHADDGTVTAFATTSGERLWSTEIGAPANRLSLDQTGTRYDAYGSGGLVAGEIAYFGTYQGGVVALHVESGEVAWRLAEPSSVLGTPATDGERLFYATFDGDVVAVEASTGSELWRTETGGSIVGAPAMSDDLLIIGNRAYDLLALNAADGSRAWRYYYWWSWVESPATVVDGVAYVGSSDATRLNAVNASDGTLAWTVPVQGWAWSAPAVTDAAVYIGTVGAADYMVSHQAHVHAIDRRTGQPIWRFDLPQPEGASNWGFASSAVVGEHGVYVGTIDGRVMAFPLGS